ncbi:type VI secretion system contractile sheath large subunit [Enterobacter hormaechei]
MLMSVNTETASAQGQTTVLEKEGVYASLFEKINLTPASSLGDINAFLDDAALSDAPAGERLTAAMQVFMDCIRKSGQPVEKLDKTLIDHHIAELDFQISRQLDAVMHHQEFQKVESLWRGLKQLVDSTDYRQNVKTEILDVSKEDLRQDFEDAPELIQSGLYWHTYTAEYDTPGGEPIGSVISSYEFDASPQDVALLRNISKVSAAAHMPFIGSVGPKFFLKDSMEEVAAIKDIGNYFDRAEYIKWKSFRDTDDARYIGLVMPRVLGRLPYGPDTVPVRSFNYVEQVKGPDHEKYLWTSASFSFASNMVKSFINNGWCVQIRGPQAGGAVKDLPIHLYDLGTGNQVKIPSEVMIPETREFEFANLGFIPLSYYKNRDYACFFSANSAQKTRYGQELKLTEELLACRTDISRQGEIPDRLSTAQLQALQQTSPPPEPGISKTQQLLAQLLHLKPDWAVSYGDRLVQQALTFWPEEAKPLAQQWHKQISVAGLAESELNGWHQGMTQLQQLTNRLNALDEQKGKYMTVSELKSAVFAMSQSFSHTVPLEERLRLLSILPAGQPLSAAQLNQTEQHLQQLIASYALLKHQKE